MSKPRAKSLPLPAPTTQAPTLSDTVAAVAVISQPEGEPDSFRVQRQLFIDQVGIALFARGFPMRDLWAQAEKLWASREQHIANQKAGK
jgi:hypothetical protein